MSAGLFCLLHFSKANEISDFKYEDVTKHVKKAFGYGDLGTQHVLSICSLFGLVKNIENLTHATIAKKWTE